MKKGLLTLLALLMVLSLGITAMAAVTDISADKAEIKKGGTVNVKLSLSEKLENITNFEYSVYYDPDLFELQSAENGAACSLTQISGRKTDKRGKSFYSVSFVDTTSEGVTIKAGTIYTLTFKAVKDITENTSSGFELKQVSMMDTSWKQVSGASVGTGKVSLLYVNAVSDTAVTDLSADKAEIKKGGTVNVKLSLSEKLENITNFEYSVYYDPDLFELQSSENGAACSLTQISNRKVDKQGKSFYSVSFVDTTSEGVTVKADTIYTLTFKAVKDITENISSGFELKQVSVMDTSWKQVSGASVGTGKANILVKCLGDVNRDGKADLKDVSLLFRWWNGKTEKDWENEIADINLNGKVDLADAAELYRILQN